MKCPQCNKKMNWKGCPYPVLVADDLCIDYKLCERNSNRELYYCKYCNVEFLDTSFSIKIWKGSNTQFGIGE